MAAISGIFSLNKDNNILEEKKECIKKITKSYKIDRFEELSAERLYLACGHQYFTNEAVSDVSPSSDEKSGVYFTGDVFLFNRKELIGFLSSKTGIEEEFLEPKGDAELVFYAYRFLKLDFLSHIKGCFSMAVCDHGNGHMYLITDHVAQRHLAYTITENSIYFSNSLEILTELMGEKAELDDEWICNAYVNMSPETEILEGRCFLKNVFRVFPGSYIDIDLSTFEVKKVTYWNPLNIKVRKDLDDKGFKKLFTDTFRIGVCSTLRARKNHGINLSGGLDSSSIASFAAEELAKEDKLLYSYTQIPLPEYERRYSPFESEDETKEVLYNKECYPNIECRFLYFGPKSCVSFIKEATEIFIQPIKPIVNLPNLMTLRQAAEEDGCSILFDGQFGNATISYGNILSYVHHKVTHLHFIDAIKEANRYCSFYHVKRPKLLKYYIKTINGRVFPPRFECFLLDRQKKKYSVMKNFKHLSRNRGTDKADTRKKHIHYLFMPITFQHFGYFATCFSFKYGFLPIDPTLSKDMIELCLSMPIECFVKNGKERRAVRDYFKGIVSDKILNNLYKRGRQAADFAFRANKFFDDEKDLIYSYLKYPKLYNYFDKEKIEKLIEKMEETKYNMEEETVAAYSVAAALGCFLKMWDDKNGKDKEDAHGT